MAELTPNYLDIDFQTIIDRIKEQMAESDVFKDYNYEGSNITLLMELLAYIGELNVYFLNKIAKNIHIETADIYEAANRCARMMGYEPKGLVSSVGTVSVEVCGATPGDEYRLLPFTQMSAPSELDDDGAALKFANTTLYTVEPTGSTFNFDVFARQGEVVTLTDYTGSDLVDNQLVLPSRYAYDSNLDDEYPSLAVFVNDQIWSRVSDFYDELSPLSEEEDVYQFVYDRYERNKLVFSSSRNVPTADDTIDLKVLNSLGSDGNVGANTITEPADDFIYHVQSDTFVPYENVTINNSTAFTGGAAAENIDTIRENSRSGLFAQFRNVVSVDYESHLETRSDVTKGKAYGEQDLFPSGAIVEFNKVHLTVIPTEWSTSTIAVCAGPWTTTWGYTGTVTTPSGFNREWRTELLEWVEPRKMISVYEKFDLPALVYFAFRFGVRLKRLYTLAEVSADIKSKLEYYFRAANQEFGSVVNFNDIIEYILDTTEVSPTDDFDAIKGIRNLNLRNIDLNYFIYEPNTDGNYPQYVEPSGTYVGENVLRKIQLGLEQFPTLQIDVTEVREET